MDSPTEDSVDVPVEKNLPEIYRKITDNLPDVSSEVNPEAIGQEDEFSGKKLGRQRTKDLIDQVLDYIAVYGDPPKDLSIRMRHYYMHHERLPERRKKYAEEKKRKRREKSNTS